MNSPPGSDHSEDVLVLLAVSGGAKRSAAFSYGAFKVLNSDDAKFELSDSRQRRVLGEADIITAASGGALTASYYVLHRDRIFEEWPSKECSYEHFLHEDTGAEIWKLYLAPWEWGWALDERSGTNDKMASFYSKRLFGAAGSDCSRLMGLTGERSWGATFADLYAKGPPVLMLQSTDVTLSTTFPFVQDAFDQLCSDLTNFPLAWAVAASNGFPIVLSTVTLENYHFASRTNNQPNCRPKGNWFLFKENGGDDGPSGILSEFADEGCDRDRFFEGFENSDSDSKRPTFFRNNLLEITAACRIWPGTSRYLHAADGGLMDNLALRSLTDWLQTHTDLDDPVMWSIVLKTRRVQLLIVDGQSAMNKSVAEDESGPDFFDSLNAMVSTTVEQGNLESFVQTVESIRLLERLLVVRNLVMVETILGSDDASKVLEFLCGGDEACPKQRRLGAAEFERRMIEFVASDAARLEAAKSKIVRYFRVSEAGNHDAIPLRWEKSQWEQFADLKRKLRIITNWNQGISQVVRLSLEDDCNSERKKRLLASETGLGISKDEVADAIAAGEQVAARHLSKITSFLSNGEIVSKPTCYNWLGKTSIEQGASSQEIGNQAH